MNALLFAAACLAVLALAWATSSSALRDPGGYRETRKTFLAELFIWRRDYPFHHAAYHVAGAAMTMLAGVLLFRAGLQAAAAVTFGAWVLVEVAERYPRKRYLGGRPGRFSGYDLLANSIGIVLVWLIVAVLR